MAVVKKQNIVILPIAVLILTFLVSLPISAGSFASWSTMTSGTTNNLNSIWGVGSGDVFAAGNTGTILHYDGSSWTAQASGTAHNLNCIWGAADNDVFTVGSSGTILHYNGSSWTSQTSGTTSNLNCVWGTGSGEIFAAGNSGTILRYDGSVWGPLTSGTAAELRGIWGTDGNNVIAAGDSGTIIYYDGLKFSPMNRNTNDKLHSVWGLSSSDMFAAGESGTILRYIPPVIYSISRGQGDQGETLNVLITGANLAGASEVRFGAGIAVNSLTIINSNQISANITIVSGAGLGPRDVSVVTPGGSFTLPESFTVKQALPTISSISPDYNMQGATQNVTITGTNLAGASVVRFGKDIATNSFTVLSSNQIAASITIAPGAGLGPRDVSVVTPGGSFTLPESFTVKQALPVITSISPAQGNQESTFDITIDGMYLIGASELRFGTGITVNRFTVLSSNQIAAGITIAAAADVGARDVTVTTPGGSFSLPGSFTVKQKLPTIHSISPDNGSQGATRNITITGTNLAGASEVRFGTGITTNSFSVFDANRITVNITIVPGTQTGARDVTVTTPGGSFSLPGSFTVTQGLPVITSISPDYGIQGTELSVVISGSNLNGATSVNFGAGAAVKGFANLSPTQLRADIVIDEDAITGFRDVSVTTPGGSSTLSSSFNIREKSTATLFVALLWVIIAVVVLIFILILRMLRKKRGIEK